MHQSDILIFLKNIREHVRSVDDLLAAIRTENQRAETYGQSHIPELLEVSAYQWQLEQLEMKLKAPSLIKISFTSSQNDSAPSRSLEEEAEALMMGIILRLISNNNLDKEDKDRRFKLIL